MWPFDEPQSQIPAELSVPRLGTQPLGDPKDLKISELEGRILGLEVAVIEVCKAIKLHQDVCNYNFVNLETGLTTLAQLCFKPRTHIMGESQDKN